MTRMFSSFAFSEDCTQFSGAFVRNSFDDDEDEEEEEDEDEQDEEDEEDEEEDEGEEEDGYSE